MYLEYIEYTSMGGKLDESAFAIFERKARCLIISQAAGQAGKRIDRIANAEGVPQPVKDCMFELMEFLSVNDSCEKQVASESQSLGGQSESKSYVINTPADVTGKCEDIIYNILSGGGMIEVLYLGGCDVK